MEPHQSDCAGAQGLAAPDAAELNPEKELADGDEIVGQAGVQKYKHHDSAEATAALGHADTEATAVKRLAGLRARLALAGGHVLHELADGSYLVTWRGLSRPLKDLDAVDAFAARLGVA